MEIITKQEETKKPTRRYYGEYQMKYRREKYRIVQVYSKRDDPEDQALLEALRKKYPSVNGLGADIMAFIRAHKDELL